MSKLVPVIAIDGPSGAGKGTIAALLAQQLGWRLLDSGALYRLLALAASRLGITQPQLESTRLAELARELPIAFSLNANGSSSSVLDGEDVSDAIRMPEISALASKVTAIPSVREGLFQRQRAFQQAPGLVADGRDMGTVVFTDADLKIFLTASAEERAQRRYKQLKQKGENVSISRLYRDIEERDERDRNRAVAPLRPAPDAIIIDSTDLSIESIFNQVAVIVEESGISL